MNNFEELMQQREAIYSAKDKDVISKDGTSVRQKANKSASLYDFIKMVSQLVELTMPNVRFEPDEGKVITLDAMKDFDCPVITYQIINRKPKKEIKARIRESIVENIDDKDDQRKGEIYGQKFECLVQFNIFASVYNDAEQVMESFEEIIIKHSGFLKKNGVAEILFDEHTTDSHFDTLRETLSIRNLRYYVEIEKLTVMFKEKIKEIEILAQKRKDEEDI